MTARAESENPEPSQEQLTVSELEKILDLQSRILGEAVISDDYQGLLSKLCSLAESFTPNSVATVMLFEPGNETLYIDHGFHGAISKPYDLNDLKAVVSQVVDEARGADSDAA